MFLLCKFRNFRCLSHNVMFYEAVLYSFGAVLCCFLFGLLLKTAFFYCLINYLLTRRLCYANNIYVYFFCYNSLFLMIEVLYSENHRKN